MMDHVGAIGPVGEMAGYSGSERREIPGALDLQDHENRRAEKHARQRVLPGRRVKGLGAGETDQGKHRRRHGQCNFYDAINIAALIAVAAVTVMGTVGTNLSGTFNSIATKL